MTISMWKSPITTRSQQLDQPLLPDPEQPDTPEVALNQNEAENTTRHSALRSRSFVESALTAALIMAPGDGVGSNPVSVAKHAKASKASTKKFRILDRDAPFQQSTGMMRIQRVNRDQHLFLMDPFHILIEMQTWRLLVSFMALYFVTFSLFGLIYWLASDLCGIGCKEYGQALLLSVETMLTIGYGVPDPYFRLCPWLVVVLIIECLVAVIYDSFFVSVVYQRISSGTTRSSTILFSGKAVIQTRGDSTLLMFRVCEMRKMQLLESHVRCYLFTRQRQDPKAEQPEQPPGTSTIRQDPMRLEQPDDALGAPVMLILPTVVAHRVDLFSPMLGAGESEPPGPGPPSPAGDFVPLQRSSDAEVGCRDGAWCKVCGASFPTEEQLRRHVRFLAESELRDCADDAPHSVLLRTWVSQPSGQEIRSLLRQRMAKYDLEVVCILEGTDPTTSSSVQVRHSYTVDDMAWDQEFAPCVSTDGSSETTIDFARFHELAPCP